MRIEPVKYDLDGRTLVFRSAETEDAEMLLPYLKRVCGETRFLMREADECEELTVEQEEAFIRSHADSARACLILAELDGEYIGNASFDTAGGSRRNYHRADIGIALYRDYTGMGIGKKLFSLIMEIIKKWWVVLILGILSLICGFWIIAHPGTGYQACKIMVTVDYLSTGIFMVATVIANRKSIPAWGWDLAAAILVVIMCLIIICVPGMSDVFLLITFAIGTISKGVVAIRVSLLLKKRETKRWGWILALGILVVILGICYLFNPAASAITIDILISASMLAFGIAAIIISIRLSKIKGSINQAKEEIKERIENYKK